MSKCCKAVPVSTVPAVPVSLWQTETEWLSLYVGVVVFRKQSVSEDNSPFSPDPS